MMMRKLVELTLEDDLKRLAGGNSNYFNRLDSSVNREAHAGYLAAVIGGAPMEEAIDRGLEGRHRLALGARGGHGRARPRRGEGGSPRPRPSRTEPGDDETAP